MSNDELIQKFKELQDGYNAKQPCPSCGHCPTCGRGHQAIPYYPAYNPWGGWTMSPWITYTATCSGGTLTEGQ